MKKLEKKVRKNSKSSRKKVDKKVDKKFDKNLTKKFDKKVNKKLRKSWQVMSPHHSDQMSQRSLCSVVKTLIVSGNRPNKQPTKGQGHLLSCCGQLKSFKQFTLLLSCLMICFTPFYSALVFLIILCSFPYYSLKSIKQLTLTASLLSCLLVLVRSWALSAAFCGLPRSSPPQPDEGKTISSRLQIIFPHFKFIFPFLNLHLFLLKMNAEVILTHHFVWLMNSQKLNHKSLQHFH